MLTLSKHSGAAPTDDPPVKVSSDGTDSAVGLGTIDTEWREEDLIAAGIWAWEKLRNISVEAVSLKNSKTLDDLQPLETPPSPDKRRMSLLEQDFTTQGAKGELKCPFTATLPRRWSRGSNNLQGRPYTLPTPPDKEQLLKDPIAVEFHANDISPPPSVNGSVPKCPIRFLDNHSPEELAKYFENHKHEIPRSHEVCVKRYQSNAESIRQLDAKYGSLVNMIQGLGMKHQPMLPTDADPLDVDKESMEKVQNWAENCVAGQDSAVVDEAGVESGSESRTARFAKALKEVRLGESPSRPWGIQVPYTEQSAMSVDARDDASHATQSIAVSSQALPNVAPSIKSSKRCPFGRGVTQEPKVSNESKPTSSTRAEPADNHQTGVKVADQPAREPPRLVFNGPVFFGYSADQATALLGCLQR